MKVDRGFKPVHLYLLSGVFFATSFSFKNDQQILYYLLFALGLIFFIWALIKYFRR